MKTAIKTSLIGLLWVVPAALFNPVFAQINLVKDIRTTGSSENRSDPSGLTYHNGHIYFSAYHPETGRELWRTDGTEAGTVLVKDFIPGPTGVHIQTIYSWGNKLILVIEDGSGPGNLWMSDGTTQGTTFVKSITLRPGGSGIRDFIEYNSNLFFVADDIDHGNELWKTDGTVAGTQVLDLVPGETASKPEYVVVVRDTLFFSMEKSQNNQASYYLMKSDGTVSGTKVVRKFSGGNSAKPRNLIAFKDSLFFASYTGTQSGYQIWRSDGTESGTMMFTQDSFPEGFYSGMSQFTLVDDKLFFSARTSDQNLGEELWVTNGTSSGTYMVKDIAPGGNSSRPEGFIAMGSKLYFSADDRFYGEELWCSDGTDSGTYMIKDIYPGYGDAFLGSHQLFVHDNHLYFTARRDHGQTTMWKTDGTEIGTVEVLPDKIGQGINRYTCALLGSSILFSGFDNQHGMELWKTDGTTAGTKLLADLYSSPGYSNPQRLTATPDALYFIAEDNEHGIELWKTSGSKESTTLVKDINSGLNSSSYPNALTGLQNELFFTAAQTDKVQFGVWKTNGASSGTIPIAHKDTNNGGAPYLISTTGTRSHIFYEWYIPDTGRTALYSVKKGSSEPILVHDYTKSNIIGKYHISYQATPEMLIYVANYTEQGANKWEFWVSDGTPEGTKKTKITETLGLFSFQSMVGSINGKALFVSRGGGHGGVTALWCTDGTVEGTKYLMESGSAPASLEILGNRMLFTSPGFAADEVWSTDGTPEGTYRIFDHDQPQPIERISSLATGSRHGAFVITDFAFKTSLWFTDGTPNGTRKVKDLLDGFIPAELTFVGDMLYFSQASFIEVGRELWQSDGTSDGTRLVQDLYPGPKSSNPVYLTAFKNKLFFSAFHPLYGRELFYLESFSLEEKSEHELQIFPNPAQNDISITYPGHLADHPHEVLVFDITGKKVLSETLHSFPMVLSLDLLSPGLYTIRLNNGRYGKFIKY